MKSLVFIFVTIIVIGITQFVDVNKSHEKKTGTYTIVIHGGAGTISKNLPDSVKESYENSLKHALQIGKDILAKGGSGLDAVEKVINYFENDPKFNAGKGAVYTSTGEHELDASIMCGKDLTTGAVAAVKHIKHPISAARLVMENSKHVLFACDGAEEFVKKMGVQLVPNSYFDTERRYEQWKEIHNKAKAQEKGTVGCVVLDEHGNLYAGTSTGGLTDKTPGRIGDSPLINDGTYANNKTCAVSCTGTGELFIRNTVAYNVSALMEYKNYSLKKAADEMIFNRLKPGDGGLIAVDKDGNYATPFNTTGMFRGVATSSGKFEVKIWK